MPVASAGSLRATRLQVLLFERFQKDSLSPCQQHSAPHLESRPRACQVNRAQALQRSRSRNPALSTPSTASETTPIPPANPAKKMCFINDSIRSHCISTQFKLIVQIKIAETVSHLFARFRNTHLSEEFLSQAIRSRQTNLGFIHPSYDFLVVCPPQAKLLFRFFNEMLRKRDHVSRSTVH